MISEKLNHMMFMMKLDFKVQYMKTCDSFAGSYRSLFRYERILSYY